MLSPGELIVGIFAAWLALGFLAGLVIGRAFSDPQKEAPAQLDTARGVTARSACDVPNHK